ncbi:MAG: ABC transporter ATP-binding protein [Cytophagales bacterium]
MKIFNPIFDVIRYLNLFKKYLGWRIYLVFILGIIASLFEGIGILMLLPLLQTIDQSNNRAEFDNEINQFLYYLIERFGFSDSTISILVLIMLAFVIKGLISFIAMGYSAYLMGILLKEIKLNLFDLYSNMKFSYYSSKDTGHFINLITEQPTRALVAFRHLTTFGSYLINTIVLITISFLLTFSFGIMSLFAGIILLFLFLKLNTYLQKLSRITASENGHLTKWLVQILQGYKYLNATSQIDLLKKNISNSISILTINEIRSGFARAFTISVREPIAVVCIILIIYSQIFVFSLTLEPILVSIALFYRALNSTLAVQSAFQLTFQYVGSMEMVDQEFKSQSLNKDEDGSIKLDDFHDSITIENISFNYTKDKKVLDNLSLKINSNSSIGIVGKSGSGKSTLVDILTLIHNPQEGSIKIDGVESVNLNKQSWRKQIGYVSQEAVVFDDNISNNVSMWKGNHEVDKDLYEEIKQALIKANLWDFVSSLPEGLNTKVGDRGILLSGGQKQRLFIARELFRKPNLLILDEATSALDSKSEYEIKQTIDKIKDNITVVVVAHRLTTIKNLDIIYVIDNGKIVETGNYNNLLKNSKSKFNEINLIT